MTLQEIGERVRERRKRLGLSQSDLASLAGCSKPTVAAVERGKPTLRVGVLLTVLQVLGLQVALAEVSGRGGDGG